LKQNPCITEGAVLNLEHPIEYQFDWEDGTLSAWVSPNGGGIAQASKTWNTADTFTVIAQARCKNHPSLVSGWSEGLDVTITSP